MTVRKRSVNFDDVDRPLYFPGKLINKIAKFCFKASIVPNLEGDKEVLLI